MLNVRELPEVIGHWTEPWKGRFLALKSALEARGLKESQAAEQAEQRLRRQFFEEELKRTTGDGRDAEQGTLC